MRNLVVCVVTSIELNPQSRTASGSEKNMFCERMLGVVGVAASVGGSWLFKWPPFCAAITYPLRNIDTPFVPFESIGPIR